MELKKRRYFTDQTGVRHGLEDADTSIRPDGEKVRFVGFDAEETDQLTKNPDGTFTFERGEVGGDLYTDIVANIIDEGDFTNVNYTGERGYYGRELADITNPEGKGLDAQLYSSGIAKLAPWTSAENTKLKLEGDMYRKFFGDANDPYAKYREALDIERQSQGLRFKTKALDESYYDPNYHNDVAFRDFDRTIDNKPRSVLSGVGDAFGMGFDGIKEGAFGYLDAIGQMTDSEMLENLGEQGVSRARERLRETPELILDYKEVNNLSTGFQYFLNNAAMSAPYMLTSFAALAAAAPVGLAAGLGGTGILAVAGIPNSVIYAGQTWNDMEGELGFSQFLAASMSGVGQATLEFLALPTLMAPVKVFSKAGQEKIVKALMNKGATKEAAEAQVASALAKNQKEFISTVVKTAGVRLQTRDFAPFSARSLGAAGAKGAGIESVTEVAQEGLQMATAAGFSDKEYSAAEVRDRLINAAIAGGSLGGGLGAAGNVYRQGKNKLNVQLRTRADQERLNAYQQFHLQQVQENGRVLSVDEQIEREEQLAAKEAREAVATADVKPQTQRDDRTSTLTDEELLHILDGKPIPSKKDPNRKDTTPLQDAKYALETLEETASPKDKKTPEYAEAVKKAEREIKRRKQFEERVRAEIAGRKDGTLKQLTAAEADALIDAQPADADTTVLGGLKINQAGQDNFVTALANNYDNATKGIRNYVKNNNKAAEFLSAAALGISKMFRGLERVAIKPAVAIKDADVMDVITRVFGALGDAVNSGQNFKEFQEEIVRRAKSLISESSIRSALVGKPGLMDHKDSLAISKMLIDFASANKGTRFAAFFAYNMLNNFNTLKPKLGIPFNTLKEMLNSLENKNISEQDIEILNQLGFNTSVNEIMVEEIKQVNNILNSKLYQDNDIDLKNLVTSQAELEQFQQLYEAGMQLKKSYDYTWSITNARILKESKNRDRLTYNPDGWWKHQGFDWEKAKKNPAGFKKMLMKELNYSATQADAIYERIAKRGETTINVVDSTSADRITEDGTAKYSLLNPGNTGRPWLFSEAANQLFEAKSVLNWTNNNLFETANKRAIDTARYVANAKYFGEGGKKLHRMFRRIARNGNLTPQELQQFAYYIKSSIDSANGNFNRIESPRMAAINSFLSSWAVLAGLPLSMPSSFPEFGMVYFDVKDDEMFQKASSTLMKQLSGTFASALDAEVDRAEKLLGAAKLDVTQSTVVDRLATGERDIAFARIHEAFFRGVGITGVTQLQRRIEAVMGLDAIKHAFDVLDLAPTKTVERFKKIGNTEVKIKVQEFDFSQFHEIEMEMYNQLTSLGINVQDMMEMFKDLDSAARDSIFEITDGVDIGRLSILNPMSEDGTKLVRDLTQREKAFRKLLRRNFQEDIVKTRGQVAEFDKYIADQAESLLEEIDSSISNALYRYINERIQLPGHSNRPLMYMDPHYQLLFQFQGFISAFTANIIPKLYDRALRRGHVKAKYDAFALIVLLIVLGGASQYLKDLIKFGQASPYLDDAGYMQRAVYASGVMGNYERVFDAIVPLYPQRNEGIAGFVNMITGEAGPGARNIQNVLTGVGQVIEGETERGVNSMLKATPLISPVTGIRRGATDILHGENPLKNTEIPDTKDLKSFFLGTY